MTAIIIYLLCVKILSSLYALIVLETIETKREFFIYLLVPFSIVFYIIRITVWEFMKYFKQLK